MSRKDRRKKKQIEYAQKKNFEREFQNKCSELKNLCLYFDKVGCLSLDGHFLATKPEIKIHISEEIGLDVTVFKINNHRPVYDEYSKYIDGVKCFYLKEKPTEVD
ncbi:MAG: hypothetical protein SO435_06570 [Peptostreptococcus porci]|nr:hypothetical protein [Peptostreptococcus porci]